MAIKLKGDNPFSKVLTVKQKALQVNLNDHIYGTFAEIGAGQETVRNFFRAGGASRTIAKSMSAYDKDFSDAIYGMEQDKRYVTESRLRKMLSHEIRLIEERITRDKHPDKLFFAYANTVATIDFTKKFKGGSVFDFNWTLSKITTKSSSTSDSNKPTPNCNRKR